MIFECMYQCTFTCSETSLDELTALTTVDIIAGMVTMAVDSEWTICLANSAENLKKHDISKTKQQKQAMAIEDENITRFSETKPCCIKKYMKFDVKLSALEIKLGEFFYLEYTHCM